MFHTLRLWVKGHASPRFTAGPSDGSGVRKVGSIGLEEASGIERGYTAIGAQIAAALFPVGLTIRMVGAEL
jgi:hypothetical protein